MLAEVKVDVGTVIGLGAAAEVAAMMPAVEADGKISITGEFKGGLKTMSGDSKSVQIAFSFSYATSSDPGGNSFSGYTAPVDTQTTPAPQAGQSQASSSTTVDPNSVRQGKHAFVTIFYIVSKSSLNNLVTGMYNYADQTAYLVPALNVVYSLALDVTFDRGLCTAIGKKIYTW